MARKGPDGSDAQPPELAIDRNHAAQRLDSWKAIADYLQRDVATVRRWEKKGLPIRRVPGGPGASVYAFPREIDAWLKRAGPEAAAPAPQVSATRSAQVPRSLVLAATIVLAAAVTTWWTLGRSRIPPRDLHVTLEPDAIVATDAHGAIFWRHSLSPDSRHLPPEHDRSARVMAGPNPSVYVASSLRFSRASDAGDGGELFALSLGGKLRWSFAFDDTVTFGHDSFGPPWPIESFAADDRPGPRRIAVAGHHWNWSASLVALLDDEGRRLGTFAHWGWIHNTKWLANGRLLISGFSNGHSAGMVALLDPQRLNGQGPEQPGSPHHCAACGKDLPLRMFVLPRSELNLATHSPPNRAFIDVTPDRVIARTIEVPAVNQEAVDVLYEFTPDLELRSARVSDRYWEIHQALEARGQLGHSRDQCPERSGPRAIQMWDPERGWRTVETRSTP